MSFASKCRSAAACLQRGSHAPTSSEIIVRWGSPCPNRLQQHKSTALPQNSGVRSRDGCNARRKQCPRSCAAPGHLIQGSPASSQQYTGVDPSGRLQRAIRHMARCNVQIRHMAEQAVETCMISITELCNPYLLWAFGSLTKTGLATYGSMVFPELAPPERAKKKRARGRVISPSRSGLSFVPQETLGLN